MEGGQLQFLSQGGTAQRGTDLGKNFRVVVTNCNPIQAISLFSLLIGDALDSCARQQHITIEKQENNPTLNSAGCRKNKGMGLI